MEENVKYNRSGKIKARSFALILLILSCSLAFSAFKSLGRSFDGIIVFKNVQNGLFRNNYNLYIDQDYNKNNNNQELNKNDIINVLVDNLSDYTKIGVSYFAYEETDLSSIIKKEKYSPIIKINNTKFLDQGLFWLIASLLGIIISIIIYKNTINNKNLYSRKTNDTDEEELDL